MPPVRTQPKDHPRIINIKGETQTDVNATTKENAPVATVERYKGNL